MRELNLKVQLNNDDKILLIEPVNKAAGDIAETKLMIARLYTQGEIDRETRELMQGGIHTYGKVHSQIRQKR